MHLAVLLFSKGAVTFTIAWQNFQQESMLSGISHKGKFFTEIRHVDHQNAAWFESDFWVRGFHALLHY